MIKEKQQLFRRTAMVLDIMIVFLSFLFVFIFRQNIYSIYTLDLFPEEQVLGGLSESVRYFNILPFVLLAWWFALRTFGLYESFRTKDFFMIVKDIIKSAFFVIIIFSLIVFIFKWHFVSRTLMIGSFVLTSLLLIVERWIVVCILRFFRKKGYNYRNILLVGTGERAERFIGLVHKRTGWGLRIVGLIDAEKERLGMTIGGEKVIGLLKDIPRILSERVIDEVMFIVPRKWLPIIEESMLACETQGVKTSLATDFFNMKIARSSASEIEGIPLIRFKTVLAEEWQLLLKRLFDIMFSLTGMIAALPIFAILVIVIKSLSPGKAVFSQVRSGLNGRKFTMYKLRTMVDDAEAEKAHLSSLNEMNGPVFKMKNDPRVTGFGRFLRRTSLDELPQLYNILRGEMSLVGPRPPIPSEVDKYEIWQRRRLSMKPGLTCLWQANGRNNVDFDKWMEMDLEYIDKWSLWLDLKILLQTIPAVVFSIGAR